mmetsp:Transcript_13687/g.30402  ORF Transcript_13687/g.30402 Transcript_13687/m.30402 type:complete len:341 (+) Transcript_13687:181-1203(+)
MLPGPLGGGGTGGGLSARLGRWPAGLSDRAAPPPRIRGAAKVLPPPLLLGGLAWRNSALPAGGSGHAPTAAAASAAKRARRWGILREASPLHSLPAPAMRSALCLASLGPCSVARPLSSERYSRSLEPKASLCTSRAARRACAVPCSARSRRALSASPSSSRTLAARRSSRPRHRRRTSCNAGWATWSSSSRRVLSRVVSSTSCCSLARSTERMRSSSLKRSKATSLVPCFCRTSLCHSRCAAHFCSSSKARLRSSTSSASASACCRWPVACSALRTASFAPSASATCWSCCCRCCSVRKRSRRRCTSLSRSPMAAWRSAAWRRCSSNCLAASRNSSSMR